MPLKSTILPAAPATADEVTLTSASGILKIKDGGVSFAKMAGGLKEMFIGDGSDGALNVTSGTTTITTEVKNYSSINVAAGATLAFSTVGKCVIKCVGDCNIAGTLTMVDKVGTAPTALDGGVGGTAPGAGAITAGVAGVKYGSIKAYIPVIFSVPVEAGTGGAGGVAASGGSSNGTGGGGGGGGFGAGGKGGTGNNGVTGGTTGAAGAGGAGKGALFLFVGGNFTIPATGVISGVGTVGAAGTNEHLGGGGGGGGAGGLFAVLVGGNATLTASAAISMNGGNGGVGGNSSSGGGAGGGGGGGGGMFYFVCSGTLANAATITVAGGTKGNNGTGGTPGTAGDDGGAGLSVILN